MGPGEGLADKLTYRDLAGRRRVRHYVLAAAAIFILLGGIVFWGWWQRGQLLASSSPAPAPQPAAAGGQLTAERRPPTDTASGLADVEPETTFAAPARPALTAVPLEGRATPGACPADPHSWQLLPIAQDNNFKRIDPACVYDGLARTVAWDLLRVTGYSAPEAAEILGFADLPWRPTSRIIGMTNSQGPMPIALSDPSYEETEGVRHPGLHVWIVNREGISAATFTLRGCYRTETVQGDRVQSWGKKYPLLCVVAMDQGEWVVMELGSHRYATRSLPTRRFFVYGYRAEGDWVSLGYQKEPFVEIRLPAAGDPAVLPLTMDLDQVIRDWHFIAGLHELSPWDAAWLGETLGVAIRPLPDHWQRLNDPSAYLAIQAEKEKWVKGNLP